MDFPLLQPLPPPGSRVGVAISGGADSTALLLRLHELAEHPLAAIHINHRWRGPDSDADAEFCRDIAARLGIPFHLRTLTPSASGNAEEEAREARLQFFTELIQTNEVDHVVTAHTRDDQAETVLFRLLRGASLTGLAGIHPLVNGIYRPMLAVTRAEVEAYLAARNQSWRTDSTNADPHFRRNRIRHQLLPQLERNWNPELSAALARTAALAWDEQQFWNAYLEPIAAGVFHIARNSLVAEASILLSHPVAVQRRLVRWAIARAKGDLRQIDHRHIESVLELAAENHEGHGRVILPAVDIMRSFEWLRFAPYEPGRDSLAARNFEVQVLVPGEAQAADGSRIRLEVVPSKQEPPTRNGNDTVESSVIACAAAMLAQPVMLRSWKPGDRYRPEGSREVEKLKVMFQEYRVPLWDRGTWPIITIGNQIVWARKFGPAAGIEGQPTEFALRVTRFQ